MIYNGATMTLQNSRPAKDYILVKTSPKGASQQTSSGIAVAASATSSLLPCVGSVVQMGPGRTTSKGEIIPPPVDIGDEVKFRDYAGNEVTIEGTEYSAVRCIDLLSKN